MSANEKSLMLKKIYIRKWLNNEKTIIGYIDSEILLIIVLNLTILLSFAAILIVDVFIHNIFNND